jgi:branched-chain amino acid transport system permease protein
VTSWVNLLVQGALLGGYYALLACGLSFLFGVMRIINLAHGSLAVIAAYLLWVIAERWDVSPFMGILAVLPIMGAVGWVLHRTIFERSLKGGALIPVLSTFGLATVTDNVLFQVFGADTRSLAPYIDTFAYDSWHMPGDIYVGKLAALVLLLAVLLLLGLHLLLARTSLGRQIRAAAEDADAAQLVGINASRIYAIATAIAVMTVALAGMSLGMRAIFDPYSGSQQLVFAFESVVIGGAGSLWGTLVGGMILGISQSIGAQISPQGFLIAGHVVFLVVLVARIYASDKVSSALRKLRTQPG